VKRPRKDFSTVARRFATHRLSLFCWPVILAITSAKFFNYSDIAMEDSPHILRVSLANHNERCAESDFLTPASTLVFQKSTPAPGITSVCDYTQFIDSCSCLTPVNNHVECKYTSLISQKHCD